MFDLRRRWNDLPLRNKGFAVIAIPLVPLLGSAALLYLTAQEQRSAQDGVAHALQIKTGIATTLSLLGDAETGVRGFMLTHNSESLRPYDDATSKIPDALRLLSTLLAEDRDQTAHLDAVIGLIDARPLLALLASAQSNPSDRTVPLALLGESRTVMAALREELGEMDDLAGRTLRTRLAVARRAEERLLSVTLGGAVLGLLGGLVAATAFTTGVTRRLDEVSRNAARLSHGAPPQAVTAGDDEVGQLTVRLVEAGALMSERVRDLETARAELDRFFSVALDMLCIADLEGRFKRVNPAWQATTGWSVEDLTAVPYAAFVHPDDVAATTVEAAKLAQGQTSINFENRFRCKDGSYRWLNWKATAVTDSGLIYAAARDITQRKLTAQALEKSIADAEATNQELEAFSYSVSHDLRAPLRHITGFGAMLQRREVLDEDGRRYIQTIVEAAGRMGRLIDDLLGFSRMGRTALATTSVDLDALVRDVMREVSAGLTDRNIVWKVHPLPVAEADSTMLRQAFVNLLSNAVKYTGTRPTAEIEIGTSGSDGDETVLFVRDNGVGFDAQYAHKLFGVFQRLHSSDDFDGTGIGLANVRRIIHRHGGRTWAEGEVGVGATFSFSLPARNGDHG